MPARQALADLLAAQRAYIGAILRVLADGGRVDGAEMRELSRRARLGRTSAEATVARSLSEPATRRIDAEQSQGALAAMRRLVQAAHVLRLDVQDDGARGPLFGLDPLARDLDAQLAGVEAALALRTDEPPARSLPDLRARYQAFDRSLPRDLEAEGLLAELDELVDAANSLAAAVGLDAADDAADSEAPAASGMKSPP